MKIFLITSLLFTFTLFQTSCNHQPGNKTTSSLLADTTNALPAVEIDSVIYHRHYGNCNEPDSPCVAVDINYPLIKGGKNSVTSRVNDRIRQDVIKMMENDSEIFSGSVDSLAGNFIEQFITMYKKFPLATAGQWFITIKGKVMNQTPKVLGIAITDFSFAGGAHPNTYEYWLNFDLQTGDLLSLADVVSDTASLIQAGEQQFRLKYRIPEGSPLNSTGFMFAGDKFFLPDNFIAYPDSLQFLYNNYQIAPYVYGQQIITLDANELGSNYPDNRLK